MCTLSVSSIRGSIATESDYVRLVKSAAWKCLVLADFDNTYNHQRMASATWLVTTKNEQSRFSTCSPVILQNSAIKIPATRLLPRRWMQSYRAPYLEYLAFAASATNELAKCERCVLHYYSIVSQVSLRLILIRRCFLRWTLAIRSFRSLFKIFSL